MSDWNWRELFPLYLSNVGRFGEISFESTRIVRRCGLIHRGGGTLHDKEIFSFKVGDGILIDLTIPGLPVSRSIELGTLEIYDLREHGINELARCFKGYCPRADLKKLEFEEVNLCYCYRQGLMDTGISSSMKRRFPFP